MAWLTDWQAFAHTVEGGSMAAAARRLGWSRAKVSKKLAELEHSLGVRLLERTTRSLSLTPSGEVFYQHALQVLNQIEETELALQSMISVPQGILRVSAPVSFGQLHIAPLLPGVAEKYPDLHCELVLNDRLVSVTEEGFDLAIRLTDSPPEDLVAKKLATIKRVICASPAYLEKTGEPEYVQDLARHSCFAYSHASTASEWRLSSSRGIETVPVQGNFQINHVESIMAAVLRSDGIAILPDYLCNRELQRGALVRILQDYEPITSFGRNVYACYPRSCVQLPKLRVFLSVLEEHFSPIAPWNGS